MAITPAATQSDLQTLHGAWQFLKPYRRLIVLGALIGFILGVTITLLRQKEYATNATLLFPASASGMAGLAGLGGGGDQMSSVPLLGGMLQVPRPGTNAKTAIILLRSRPVIEAVIADKDIALGTHWTEKKPADIREKLMKHLALREGTAGDLSITFTDTNPELSFHIARKFIDELKAQSTALGLSPADETVNFLQQQVALAEADANAAQAKLQRFEEKHGVVSLPDQVTSLARQYSGLQDDVEKARIESAVTTRNATLLTANAQQLIAKSMDPTPVQGQLNALYQKVAELEAQRELLRDKFTTTSPEYQDLALQLRVARERLSVEMNRQLKVVDGGSSPVVGEAIIEAALAQTRLQRLSGVLDALKTQIGDFPVMKSQYARMSLDVETQQARVTLLRSELEKAKIVAQNQGPAFVEAEPPVKADEAQSRHGLLITLIFTILGALATAVVPYFRWQQALVAREAAPTT